MAGILGTTDPSMFKFEWEVPLGHSHKARGHCSLLGGTVYWKQRVWQILHKLQLLVLAYLKKAGITFPNGDGYLDEI